MFLLLTPKADDTGWKTMLWVLSGPLCVALLPLGFGRGRGGGAWKEIKCSFQSSSPFKGTHPQLLVVKDIGKK